MFAYAEGDYIWPTQLVLRVVHNIIGTRSEINVLYVSEYFENALEVAGSRRCTCTKI
jgi:hypothetical protein